MFVGSTQKECSTRAGEKRTDERIESRRSVTQLSAVQLNGKDLSEID